jgi:hypothetical protein
MPIASGKSRLDAWRPAIGGNGNDNTARKSSCLLAKQPEVAASAPTGGVSE